MASINPDATNVLNDPPPIPASTLPGEGARNLTEGVFQSAEEAVLGRGADDLGEVTRQDGRRVAGSQQKTAFMASVRQHVAQRPGQSALLAALTGSVAMLLLRRQVSGRVRTRQ